MRYLKIFLISIAAIIIHSTIIKLFYIGNFKPDLCLLAVIYISLSEGTFVGIWTGFLMGLLQDIYHPSVLGANALAKSLIGYLTGFFNNREWKIDIRLRAAILFISFIIHDVVIYISRQHNINGIWHNLFYNTIPSYLYTLLIWIVFWFFHKQKEQTI